MSSATLLERDKISPSYWTFDRYLESAETQFADTSLLQPTVCYILFAFPIVWEMISAARWKKAFEEKRLMGFRFQ